MLKGRITGWHLARELIAFAFTVACAWFLRWQAKDLIWGLWTSSLCVGYSFIVFTIVSGAVRASQQLSAALAALGALFLLAFFTVHFGMFHFVHSVFLNAFFPLTPERGHGFPNLLDTLAIALRSYWPVVLATFVSRWHDFRVDETSPGGGMDGKAFAKAYANVIRMHILIFVFAGLSIAHATDLALYPVLAFYFFPWGRVLRKSEADEE